MKRRFLPVAASVAALAIAGCGGDDNSDTQSAAPPPTTESTPTTTDSGSGGGTKLALSADPSGALKFDKDSLTAKAGEISIDMANPSSTPHAIAVKGGGVDTDGPTVNKNGTSKITVTLKAGKYEFYCPVAGHEAGGMKGTLTVK